MFITNHFLIDLSIGFITVFIATFIYIKHKYSYWTKRGIPQISPTFPFGNYGKKLPRGFSLGPLTKRYYDTFKKSGVPLGGVYMGLDPHLVVVDPVYAKNMLTTDFQYFVNRGIYLNRKNFITVNILTQEEDEWRTARGKLTSIFTSSKMKFFLNTIKDCRHDLRTHLESLAQDNADVDIYEVMGCYYTDIVGSLIYGVEANSFKRPDAVFRKLGTDLFESFTVPFQIMLFLTICYPKVATLLRINNFQSHIQKFFLDFAKESLEYRTKNNIYRADLMQVFIEMKNSGINLTVEEMVAQSFIIFTGGFETSSSLSMLLLYELGLNKDIQDKARKEINDVLRNHNGDFDYESINELTYLNKIFHETLRKYPTLATLSRVCVKDYKFPDSDIVIEKGTRIIFPVLGYHRDPDYFSDPMKFDPDRFEDNNFKCNGFFPFGDGPRNCIGARLGLLQVKLGLAEVIGKYEISVSPKTVEPLEFNEYVFVTRMKQKIFLKLKKIVK